MCRAMIGITPPRNLLQVDRNPGQGWAGAWVSDVQFKSQEHKLFILLRPRHSDLKSDRYDTFQPSGKGMQQIQVLLYCTRMLRARRSCPSVALRVGLLWYLLQQAHGSFVFGWFFNGHFSFDTFWGCIVLVLFYIIIIWLFHGSHVPHGVPWRAVACALALWWHCYNMVLPWQGHRGHIISWEPMIYHGRSWTFMDFHGLSWQYHITAVCHGLSRHRRGFSLHWLIDMDTPWKRSTVMELPSLCCGTLN